MATQPRTRVRTEHSEVRGGPRSTVNQGQVEIGDGCLTIRDLKIAGPAFEAARTCVARGEEVGAVVREMLTLGGQMLLHGASQATVDSVAAEVDRLIDRLAVAAADELPKSLEAPLQRLDVILDEHFDGKRKDSVQQQVVDAVDTAAAAQQKLLIDKLVDDNGPLGAIRAELSGKLQSMASQQGELLTRLSAVSEQMTGTERLKRERQVGTAKGRTYEEQVIESIESIFRPYEDIVEPTGLELGTDQNKCGDGVVYVNVKETSGNDARIVVEAKDRALKIRPALGELDRAMSNRDATVGMMVFATGEQAPLPGHSLHIYPGNRVVVVFDPEEGDPLPLEMACELARGLAIAGVDRTQPKLDGEGITEDLERLTKVIDDARSMRRGLNAAYKGLDQADAGYEQLRREALAVASDIQNKLS